MREWKEDSTTKCGKTSFIIDSARLWNQISANIKSAKILNQAKSAIKSYCKQLSTEITTFFKSKRTTAVNRAAMGQGRGGIWRAVKVAKNLNHDSIPAIKSFKKTLPVYM